MNCNTHCRTAVVIVTEFPAVREYPYTGLIMMAGTGKIMLKTNNRKLYKKILMIALPIALQSLIGSSLSLIDNLMVGSLGEARLAAVGAGVQIFFLYWMIIFGFTSGGALFVAQFWGVRDMTGIRRTVGFTARTAFVIALLFFAAANLFPGAVMKVFSTDPEVISMGVRYIRICSPCFLFVSVSQPLAMGLRTTQQPRIPLLISSVAFLTNTFLNYLLIFGKLGLPRMETDGAALATTIARAVEMLLLVFTVFGRRNIISGRPGDFLHAPRDLRRNVIRRAVPTTANETLWSLGQTMYMSAVGHIGVTAYAAAQAGRTIEDLFFLTGFSIGDAALILIGEKLGEGKTDEARSMAHIMIRTALIVGTAAGVLMIILSRPVLNLFDFTPLGRSYAGKILLVYGILLPLNLYTGVQVSGILRSGGDTLFAAVCEISTVWLIGVPLAFTGALVLKLPVYLVLFLARSEEIVKAVILTLRFRSGRWARNVIHDI